LSNWLLRGCGLASLAPHRTSSLLAWQGQETMSLAWHGRCSLQAVRPWHWSAQAWPQMVRRLAQGWAQWATVVVVVVVSSSSH
jgi:hypothetical protein